MKYLESACAWIFAIICAIACAYLSYESANNPSYVSFEVSYSLDASVDDDFQVIIYRPVIWMYIRIFWFVFIAKIDEGEWYLNAYFIVVFILNLFHYFISNRTLETSAGSNRRISGLQSYGLSLSNTASVFVVLLVKMLKLMNCQVLLLRKW